MWYVLGGLLGLFVLFVLFILWRLASVSRGAQQRDARILAGLEPLGRRLEAGETVTPEEVRELAQRPETRYILFPVLRELKRADLLPTEFNSPVQQAEAALCYWMMHPNELQDPPEAIELLEAVPHTVNGDALTFYVFRYRMPEGHWAGTDWLLGLAGPVNESAGAYAELPGAFSRCGDKEGDIPPADLVAWYVGMMKQKGVYT